MKNVGFNFLPVLGFLLSASLFAVSCCRENEIGGEASGCLCIESVITGTALPSDGNGIGVFVKDKGKGPYDGLEEGYSNVKFTPGQNGWTAATPVSLSSTEGKLYAYYPYSGEVSDAFAVPVGSSLDGTDWLYATPVGVSNVNNKVSLTMNHALSRFHITLRNATYNGECVVSNVKLTGKVVDVSGTLDLTTGIVTPSKAADADGIFEAAVADGSFKTGDMVFDFLLVPGSSRSGDLDVTLTIDDKAASVTVSDIALGGGEQNDILIIVKHNGLSLADDYVPDEPVAPSLSDGVRLWENGLFWAPYNVGAASNSPEDCGWYFMWGDTRGYEYEDGKFYKVGTDSEIDSGGFAWDPAYNLLGFGTGTGSYPDYGFTKYDSNGPFVLELSDDAARANWGSSWRMPTEEDFEALAANCYCTWTDSYNGTGVAGCIVYKDKDSDAGYWNVNGALMKWNGDGFGDNDGHTVTAPYGLSDVHIFFPAAGSGSGTGLEDSSFYWSGTLDPLCSRDAFMFGFDGGCPILVCYHRYYGFPVRPVWSKAVESITLAATDVTITSNGSFTINATVLPSDAYNRKLTFCSAQPRIASVNADTGVVTGVAAGTTTITASATDGSGVTATCTVTVEFVPEPTEMEDVVF